MKSSIKPTYLKINYLLLTILMTLPLSNFSCSSAKKSNTKLEKDQSMSELNTHFNVSAKTIRLINEIQTELTEQKTNIKEYMPTKKIITKYHLIKIDDIYHIIGMMLINENFSKSVLDNISVKAGNPSGKFTTVQIPVSNFDQFLEYEGIDYFEVTEKANTN